MTKAAQEFITPLAVGALSATHVYTELFSREDEQDVGHIRLARDTDLIIVAPASADLMAKMAHGLADDLASTILLATDRPVLVAPAMNPKMWTAAPTTRNVATLKADGIHFIGPMAGEMAEKNEAGFGRMAEPLDIVAAAEALFADKDQAKPLAARRQSSPPGRRMSRSTRCAILPTALRGGRAMRLRRPLRNSAPR